MEFVQALTPVFELGLILMLAPVTLKAILMLLLGYRPVLRIGKDKRVSTETIENRTGWEIGDDGELVEQRIFHER